MINAQTYMEWSVENDMSLETCWTFVSKVLKETFAIQLPELQEQESIFLQQKETIKQQQLSGDWIQVEKPQAGDIVLLMLRLKRPHVGIMVDNKSFLHFSESDKTVKRDQYCGLLWRNRVEGFYRHNSV